KLAVQQTVKEEEGEVAPKDGVVVLVHQQYWGNIPYITQHIAASIFNFGGGFIQNKTDRIIVRSCPNLQQLLAHLQKWLRWSGTILLNDGQKMSTWQYAHFCEKQGVPALGLVPDEDVNDATVIKDLMLYALNLKADTTASLLQLATQCIYKATMTTAVIRAVSSKPVNSEFERQSMHQKARFLCSLALLDDASQARLNHWVTTNAHFKVLCRIRKELGKTQDSVFIRSRAFIAVKAAVPADGAWHSWDSILGPDGPLAAFWKDVKRWVDDRFNLTAPSEWHAVPEVMAMVMSTCGNVEVDLLKGILRKQAAPEPPPPEKPKPPPWAASEEKTAGTAAASSEVDDSASSLTIAERIEDAVLELYKMSKKSQDEFLDPKEVKEHLKLRLKDFNQLPSDFAENKHTFETPKGGGVRIRLEKGAFLNAEIRAMERENAAERKGEMTVCTTVLPQLSPDRLPKVLKKKEMCGLMVLMGETKGWQTGIPSSMLKLLLADKQDNKQLLLEMTPFHAAHLMRSIVSCEKVCDNKFHPESLCTLVQVAAMDIMIDSKQPPRCRAPLAIVRDSVRAAAQKVFVTALKAKKPEIMRQFWGLACCRAQMEASAGNHFLSSYSSFTCFAEFMQAMANLYSSAKELLKTEVDVAKQTLTRLRNACELLSKQETIQGTPIADPEGLSRLVWVFANFAPELGEETREDVVKPALKHIEKSILQCRFCDSGWSVHILCTLLVSYRQAGAPCEELLHKVASALRERAGKKETELKRADVVRILQAYRESGLHQILDSFLQSLQEKQWFKHHLKDAGKEEIPILLAAMLRVKDDAAFEDFERYIQGSDKMKDYSLSHLTVLMKELQGRQSGKRGTNAREQLWKSALSALNRTKTAAPGDVEAMLEVAASEAELCSLREWCSQGWRLDSIPKPELGWEGLADAFQRMLGPFAHAKERVERLEAACAGRLLLFINRHSSASSSKPRSPSVKDVAPAALEIPAEALAGMPAVTALLSEVLDKDVPQQDSNDKDLFLKLVSHLLDALKPTTKAHRDQELEKWVEKAEAVVADGKPGATRQLSAVEVLMQQKEEASQQKAKEALGQSWLKILLARSRKTTWAGGDTVQAEAPRPQATLRGLAKTAKSILGPLESQVLLLKEEAVPQPKPEVKKPAPAWPGAGASPASSSKRPCTELAKLEKPPPPKRAPKGSVATALACKTGAQVVLSVVDAQNKNLVDMVEGRYCRESTHHGRDVFKRAETDKDKEKAKENGQNSSNSMFLYFWDDTIDGEAEDRGWWFGTEVGGAHVARQQSRTGKVVFWVR
ncbi:unnamed protein product, partial [Symbiodinium natans]